jgi:hypothetical protein
MDRREEEWTHSNTVAELGPAEGDKRETRYWSWLRILRASIEIASDPLQLRD